MTQKTITAEKERHQNIKLQLQTLVAKRDKAVKNQKQHHDYSAETCRLINILNNKITVTENRLSGKFETAEGLAATKLITIER